MKEEHRRQNGQNILTLPTLQTSNALTFSRTHGTAWLKQTRPASRAANQDSKWLHFKPSVFQDRSRATHQPTWQCKSAHQANH
jgi:hypothetical protein